MKKQNKDIKSKKISKIKKENNSKEFIFILFVLVVIVVIFVLSLNNKKDVNELYNFDITEFNNITPIGINEYMSSLNFEGTSIIFFCTNDNKNCYKELESLNSIAKKNNLYIEFINVLELVEEEKEQLKESSNCFKDSYYPNLIIIRDKKIQTSNSTYLTESQIITLLEQHEII